MGLRDRKSAKKFSYRARSAEQVKKRASQSGSNRDSMFNGDVQLFKPSEGDNNIRILYPTWDGAEHYGLDAFVHYGIGADESAYLCPHEMKGEPCPICEERHAAQKAGDTEYADKLKPSKRVLVYIINRDKPKDGVQLWSMAWTIDRDISALAIDKRTGEVYAIDHPDEGYDISFERKGTGMKTEYLGLQIDRRPSPIGNDQWEEYIQAHPIPDLLNFFDYDHIKAVLEGAVASPADDDDDGDAQHARTAKAKYRDSETPAGRGRAPERTGGRGSHGISEADLEYSDLESIESFDDFLDLLDKYHVSVISPDELEGDEELPDLVAELAERLGLEPPARAEKSRAPKSFSDLRSRFSKQR